MPNKNTAAVVDAFIAGKPLKKCASIWTDGVCVWSYRTIIACKTAPLRNHAILNTHRYSVTTSRHQNGMRVLLRQSGWSTSDERGHMLFA